MTSSTPHNRHSDDPAKQPMSVNDETRAVFSMLTETIVALAPAGCGPVERLVECCKSFESASGLADFRPLHDAIAEALAGIREENNRLRKNGSPKPASQDAPDPATGLPGPNRAIDMVQNCLTEGTPLFILVAVLGQLRALNARFGRSVGDEVLALVAEDFNRELGEYGGLFRWRGPAFVVFATKGPSQARSLEQRIKSLAARRLEKTVNIESRSIHLKIAFSWEMQEVTPDDSPEAAIHRIDQFVSPHYPSTS